MEQVYEKRRAVGCHVFAGGFTGGVKSIFDVGLHVERHGFGLETSRRVWEVPDVVDSHPSEWPYDSGAEMCFSNPRCTAWSCTTAGYGETGHGVLAHQCQDTRDVFDYAMGRYPIVVLESVNQAYTTGAPLFAEVTERAQTMGYRVAHVFMNAATFGCPQQRRRYFYILYPREKQFNVSVPEVYPYYPVIYDAIGHLRHRTTEPWDRRTAEYHRDSYAALRADDMAAIPHLATGWCLNTLGGYGYEYLSDRQRKKWDERTSSMPFSMHSVVRTAWMRPCPTLQSSSVRLVHPWHHRPFTIGELAACMGWGDKIPIGHDPCHQLAKGVVPAVGEWIAEQCLACLEDAWNGEEWTVRYDDKRGVFDGEDSSQMLEKVIDVSQYVGQQFDAERYPEEIRKQCHRFNVDPVTGKLIKAWKNVQTKGYLL